MLRFCRVAAFLPLALAGLLWWSDWTVARLLLPFRETLFALLAAQVLMAGALACRRGCAKRVRVRHAAAAVIAVILGISTYAREYAEHREETVRFQSAGVELAGTLYTPRTAPPYPGIVLVHGSGKFPRRMYRYWGQGLVRLGFQVLVYDKRGAGDSGGIYEGENNTSKQNLQLLSDDASYAVDYLLSRRTVTDHVGLFGISQGGWVATLAAQSNPRVRFLILHSGPAVSVGEENLFSDLTGEGHALGVMQRQEAERRVGHEPPRGFDPRPALKNLDVTGLWLYGEHDTSVPVRKSVAALEKLAAEGKPYAYKIFHGADHLLLTRDGNTLPDIPPGYWNTIIEWARQYEHRTLTTSTGPRATLASISHRSGTTLR